MPLEAEYIYIYQQHYLWCKVEISSSWRRGNHLLIPTNLQVQAYSNNKINGQKDNKLKDGKRGENGFFRKKKKRKEKGAYLIRIIF
jgi:hypothetical protein